MSKTSVLFALCLLLCAIAIATAEVKFSFKEEYVIADVPVQLRISLNDVNPHGFTFIPRQLDEQLEQNPQVWRMSLPGYDSLNKYIPYFGYGTYNNNPSSSSSPTSLACINEKTGQVFANITRNTDNTFVLQVIGAEQFATKYNAVDGWGQWDVLCPIFAPAFTAPITTQNIFSTWDTDPTNSTAPIGDANSTLAIIPTREPHLVFTNLKYDNTKTREAGSSHVVHIEFTTDTAGLYQIVMDNGFFLTSFSLSSSDVSPLYCSQGSDTKFARLVVGEYANVYVEKVATDSKSPIKCTLYTYNGINSRSVRTERTGVTISIGQTSVTRVNKLSYPIAQFAAYFSEDSWWSPYNNLIVGTTTDLRFTTTPLNINSTITFDFSSHFNMDSFLLNSGEQGYRNFTDCSNIRGTVFVDGNKIIIKDVYATQGSYLSELTCSFQVDPNLFLQFNKQAHMGSVTVSIDGKKLQAYSAPGTAQPIYFPSGYKITSINHEERNTDSTITVIDTIQIADNYAVYHGTPNNPILILDITGGQTFNYDDYGSQLECFISTPDDSTLSPLALIWDKDRLYWHAPLKSIIDVEAFQLTLQCTRTVKILTQYGIDITPISSLDVDIIDLVDKKRYMRQVSRDLSTSLRSRTQPTTRPSGATTPSKALPHVKFAGTMVLPPTEMTYDTLTTTIKDWSTTVKTALEATAFTNGTKIYQDWAFATPIAGMSTTPWNYELSSAYYSTKVADVFQDFNNKRGDFQASPLPLYTEEIPYKTVSRATDYSSRNQQMNMPVEQLFSVTPANVNTTRPSTFDASEQLYLSMLSVDRYTKPVPNPDNDFAAVGKQTGNMYYASPVSKCGWTNGLQFGVPTPAVGSEPVDFSDFVNVRQGYTSYATTNLCFVGGECTINADCESYINYEQAVCQAGKCTILPKQEPVWISYEWIQTEHFDKVWFNNASMMSTTLAIIAIIAALLF